MRRLLGNGKWYGLYLRSRLHNQFSNQCSNFHKDIFKTMETVSEPENLGLSEKQGIWRVHGCLFANYSHKHATSTTKCHFMDSTKWLQTWLIPSGLFINEIFRLYEFHCNTQSLCRVWHIQMFLIFLILNISWVFVWIVTNV